jgi:aldose sugar dehydrogenase
MPTRTPTFGRSLAHASLALLAATALGIAACGGGGGSDDPPAPPPPSSGPPRATVLGVTLSSPWGMAFLPDGRMLVTQKAGSMVIVRADGSAVDATVSGVPAVNAGGQGGLLDVALDPDFATSPWVYFTFAENGTGGAGVALARGQLVGSALQNVAVIWRQQPKVSSGSHFGSRIVFRSDKTLYVTLGDRGQDDPANPGMTWSQDPTKTIGKVVRLNRDGSIPTDNPVFAQAGALPGIYSLGHRNAQGAALRPGTSELWLTEHGPQGGDELNRVLPGLNYGWPIKSYGCPYGSTPGPACQVSGGTHAPTYEEPKTTWVPTSSGALAGTTLWRIVLDGNSNVASREEVSVVEALGKRIRNVRQGPDGWIYLLTDDGRIVRVDR